MKYLDAFAVLILLVCCCCCEAEGQDFLKVLAVVFVTITYLMIRLFVCDKEEKRKEEFRNRRAYFDMVERERRKHEWF